MRRREFVRFLAWVGLIWPLKAAAQHPGRRTLGVLLGYATSAKQPLAVEVMKLIQDALKGAGWVEGDNLRVDAGLAAAIPRR